MGTNVTPGDCEAALWAPRCQEDSSVLFPLSPLFLSQGGQVIILSVCVWKDVLEMLL